MLSAQILQVRNIVEAFDRKVGFLLIRKNRRSFSIVIIYAVLFIGSLIMFYPFLFQVLASLGTDSDYYRAVIVPIPTELRIDRYVDVFSQPTVYRLFLNTIFRCIWFILVTTVVSMFGGYVFSKLRFKGKNAIFVMFLSSMMIPEQVRLLPHYLILARWPGMGGNNWLGQGGHGMIDSWAALLIGGLVPVYFIFLMKQMMESLPYEYEEASRIDGAGTLRIIFGIYMPMVKPMLATIFILAFIGTWNDYLLPLIVISSPEKNVIATGMASLMSMRNIPGNLPKYPFIFTLATIAIMPPILVYLSLQKYFVQGFAMSGIKG